ncbi:MAG: YitT family protein [Sediminispirochaetaceae bacterium]
MFKKKDTQSKGADTVGQMSSGIKKQRPKITLTGLLKQIAGIALGSIAFGAGLSWFLVPFKVAPGGVGAVGQIFYHLFGWQVGVTMIILNIPLWIIGIVLVGKQFGFGTFAGFFVSAVAVDVMSLKNMYRWGILRDMIEKYNTTAEGVLKPENLWAMTDSIFVAAIAGALLLGLGIGMIFKVRASTGGTDIPVAILKKHFNISMGNGYLIVETAIILTVGIVFKDVNIIIWSYFALYLSAKFVDIVTEGISRVTAAYLISMDREARERIKQRVYEEMGRGATFFHGTGSYSQKPIEVIYVTFHVRQTAILTRIAREEDPNVFMVMHDVHDVIGSGFKTRAMEI